MNEFLLILREDLEAWNSLTPQKMQAEIETHMRWVEELTQKGHFKGGHPLESTGSMIRGKLVTDGPYMESKEAVSGYYCLLAKDLQQATAIAKGCPILNAGGSVEVRQLMWYGEEA
jgi:hypothetical protein